MRFAEPPRKPRGRKHRADDQRGLPAVDLFFLLTAHIGPSDPFPITPPDATAGDPAEGEFTLYLGRDGTLAYQDSRGTDAALAALSAARTAYCAQGGCSEDVPPQVLLRADAQVPGKDLAALLPKIASAGFTLGQARDGAAMKIALSTTRSRPAPSLASRWPPISPFSPPAPQEGATSSGSGGDALVSISAADPQVAEMVDKWQSAPQVASLDPQPAQPDPAPRARGPRRAAGQACPRCPINPKLQELAAAQPPAKPDSVPRQGRERHTAPPACAARGQTGARGRPPRPGRRVVLRPPVQREARRDRHVKRGDRITAKPPPEARVRSAAGSGGGAECGRWCGNAAARKRRKRAA